MVGTDSGTVKMSCIVQVTRNDLQTLMRQGWVLIGDGKDRRDETRRERRERWKDSPNLSEMSQRERDDGVEAVENNEELSALLYLNGANRDENPDMSLDFDSYVKMNVSLETFYRLLDGDMMQWGERYGRPLYIDSDGVEKFWERGNYPDK